MSQELSVIFENNKTQIISIENDFTASLEELKFNKNKFFTHSDNESYKESGPLRECLTLHLAGDIDPKNLCPSSNNENKLRDDFQQTISLLTRLREKVDPLLIRNIGRVYVTIIPQDKKIYSHSDYEGEYWNQIERFQFYYTGNMDVYKRVGEKRFQVMPGYFYFFDHKKIHRYANKSENEIYLLVFDLFE